MVSGNSLLWLLSAEKLPVVCKHHDDKLGARFEKLLGRVPEVRLELARTLLHFLTAVAQVSLTRRLDSLV